MYIVNKILFQKDLKQKQKEISLNLPWIETLDNINKVAPLAPELAVRMQEHEQKRENQLKNNKKLSQFAPSEDPVLNDFKRETMFYRQAQATVLELLPKLKSMGIPTIRYNKYIYCVTTVSYFIILQTRRFFCRNG